MFKRIVNLRFFFLLVFVLFLFGCSKDVVVVPDRVSFLLQVKDSLSGSTLSGEFFLFNENYSYSSKVYSTSWNELLVVEGQVYDAVFLADDHFSKREKIVVGSSKLVRKVQLDRVGNLNLELLSNYTFVGCDGCPFAFEKDWVFRVGTDFFLKNLAVCVYRTTGVLDAGIIVPDFNQTYAFVLEGFDECYKFRRDLTVPDSFDFKIWVKTDKYLSSGDYVLVKVFSYDISKDFGWEKDTRNVKAEKEIKIKG